MVLHGSCLFCELFFRSIFFPARVRAQVHVRSDLDASAVSPFFFSGPFPPFSGPFGVSVSPCVRTPSSSSQPGPWRMVHSSLWPFTFCACRISPRKRTLLKGTPTWLQALCRTCDGNHFHAPWKDSLGLHTAEEAAYPLPFCPAICKLLRDSLPPHSRPRPVFLGKALPQWRDDAFFLRAAVKFQPRSWVFPNLPSPFDLQLFPQDLFDTSWFQGKRLPAGPWPKGSVLPLHPPKAAQGQN